MQLWHRQVKTRALQKPNTKSNSFCINPGFKTAYSNYGRSGIFQLTACLTTKLATLGVNALIHVQTSIKRIYFYFCES